MPGGESHRIALPLTLIAIGAALLAQKFGWLRGDIWGYWPVLLIVWGVGMIWSSRKG
jgi:hypothetical protein